MKQFAHRGIIDYENTIPGVLEILNTHPTLGVEIDVRYNTAREIVLCHDRECRNNNNSTLEELLSVLADNDFSGRNLMMDIKAFGTHNAKKLAYDVCLRIANNPKVYQNMNIYLCSFNEYCVSELCFYREDMSLSNIQIGVISTGIPLGLFKHLDNINFVSMEYGILCEEIMESLKHVDVFAWVVNDVSMKQLMSRYEVNGIIYDVSSGGEVRRDPPIVVANGGGR